MASPAPSMQTVDYNKFEDGMKAAIVEGAAEYEPVSHVPSIHRFLHVCILQRDVVYMY